MRSAWLQAWKFSLYTISVLHYISSFILVNDDQFLANSFSLTRCEENFVDNGKTLPQGTL
jgi:hypothetical protein